MLNEIRLIRKNQRTVNVAPLKAEIEVLKNKKRKAIDLMLEDLITKDDLKQQTEFYDDEITKLTNKSPKVKTSGRCTKSRSTELQRRWSASKTLRNVT
ncbi:MAG: hypothetical protein NC299_13485 [Lachnospiraceae bacterium]|nr:hypothetical protein [Ruminococcus sp.]MCM1276348.1 hypothetical protein [Lachnospiraceae bacterium]